MPPLQFIRDDLVRLTQCIPKGHHTINREVLKQLTKPGDEVPTTCTRCNCPLIVTIDPEDPEYYIAYEE